MIPDGQPGAGQHFLPLENNGKEVDLDLVNNIMREPYADRFRLILNDLGAGLAARGKDLEAIVKRADPALRQTDRVLASAREPEPAARQARRELGHVLAPLARERAALAGFINNANTAGEATAERSAALEAGFQKFPAALQELRLTMAQLQRFADQATPCSPDFRTRRAGHHAVDQGAGPVRPRGHAGAPDASARPPQESQQPLVNSDPTLVQDPQPRAEGARPAPRTSTKLLSTACARPAATSS